MDASDVTAAITAGNRAQLRQLFKAAGAGDSIELSSCRGGTQQIFNRLGQQGVRAAQDLVVLYLNQSDNLESLVQYISGAFRGEQGEVRIPNAPIAIAQPGTDGGEQEIVRLVFRRPTAASRLVAQLFSLDEAHVVDVLGVWDPELPEATGVVAVPLGEGRSMLERVLLESLVSGRPVPGDVVLFTEPGHGSRVVGIGEVDLVYPVDGGVQVVFRRSTLFAEPAVVSES